MMRGQSKTQCRKGHAMKISLIFVLSLILTACSGLPPTINSAPSPNIQLQTQAMPEIVGKNVRWGGRIIGVDNAEDSTTIQLLAFPLNSFGRPISDDESVGRFIIYSDGFLDPEVYKVDRYMTVFGTVTAEQSIQVGQKTLHLPVVKMSEYHIWKPEQYYDDDFRSPYWLRHQHYYRGYYW